MFTKNSKYLQQIQKRSECGMDGKRAVRPYYMMVEDIARHASTHGALVERDRALALEAVIAHAPELGIEEALKKFGDSLLPTEIKLLRTLTPEELKALKSIKAKVGDLFGGKGAIINIYE
jgi:hypothetical protein